MDKLYKVILYSRVKSMGFSQINSGNIIEEAFYVIAADPGVAEKKCKDFCSERNYVEAEYSDIIQLAEDRENGKPSVLIK